MSDDGLSRAGGPRKPRKALLFMVDEDELVALAARLGNTGLQVVPVGTLDESRRALDDNDIELCFVEVRSSQPQGLSLIRVCRQQDAKRPIVVLSSNTDLTSRVAARDAGAADYLATPVRNIDLEMRVTRILSELWHRDNPERPKASLLEAVTEEMARLPEDMLSDESREDGEVTREALGPDSDTSEMAALPDIEDEDDPDATTDKAPKTRDEALSGDRTLAGDELAAENDADTVLGEGGDTTLARDEVEVALEDDERDTIIAELESTRDDLLGELDRTRASLVRAQEVALKTQAEREKLEALFADAEKARRHAERQVDYTLNQARTLVQAAQERAVPRAPSVSDDGTPPPRSEVDPLTGLLFGEALHDHLDREYGRARRYGHPLTLLLLDVDRLAKYNKRFGKEAGDRALCLVADVLRSTLRVPDIAARQGSDSFVVLATDTTAEQAAILAQRLRDELRNEAAHSSLPAVTVSMGIASAKRADVARAEDLLRVAEDALAKAKGAGRDRIQQA